MCEEMELWKELTCLEMSSIVVHMAVTSGALWPDARKVGGEQS